MSHPEALRDPSERGRWAEAGQSLVLIALSFMVLIVATGLGVDVGLVLTERERLQNAVDAAALGAVPDSSSALTVTGTVRNRITQVLTANGKPPGPDMDYTATVPNPDQLQVTGVYTVNTVFMRIMPPLSQVRVQAVATAQYAAYGEIPIKPTADDIYGHESSVNVAVWGTMSIRGNGDPYSPLYDGSTAVPNPDYGKLPYGYIYRISVPATYTGALDVQLFDPDDYNAPLPASGVCNTGSRNDTLVNRSPGDADGRPIYCRVDEIRPRVDNGSNEPTTTKFTLWYLSPTAKSILYPRPSEVTTIATYYTDGCQTGSTTRCQQTDLQWVTPGVSPGTLAADSPPNTSPGCAGGCTNSGSFRIPNVTAYAALPDGSRNFFLYVQGIGGASENNFDIRTGPPGQTLAPEIDLATNRQNIDVATGRPPVWNTGGTYAYAERAMLINFNNQATSTRYITFVPPTAAGQKMIVRHFDNDRGGHDAVTWYMQGVATGTWSAGGNLSGNDEWYGNNSLVLGDVLQLPDRTSAVWTGVAGRWLVLDYVAPFSQDTSCWEVIYPQVKLLN